MFPVGKLVPGLCELVITKPGQLSVIVGGIHVTGLHEVKLAGTLVIMGAILSITVTVNEQDV